jgi:GNAT superfamily N-acetyltransferase
MNRHNSEPETIWYLEMEKPEELRPKGLPPETQLVKFGIALPAMNRFFYLEVGKMWQWTEHEAWTEEQWRDWADRKEHQTWMLLYKGTPAGYFELITEGRDVELAYFGLLPPFVGKGLGGGLLSAAIENAWGTETNRVWVHTSSLDHPYALKNYQARGFQIYRETLAS